ncbi:HEPN domain-containing protein [Miniphocaeibacter massiliensis]|uniref:HEPN domain-containing protein n=1 Tax=Miniphocaeibacter massiliensis TaxID=2041841 RepID=UPI000C082A2D|nr:HEPN domain-containing protein [Miniphocaeibacter massiliensis]
MRYLFIAPIFNLNITDNANINLTLENDTRITNRRSLLNNYIYKDKIEYTLGEINLSELENNPYIYKFGDYNFDKDEDKDSVFNTLVKSHIRDTENLSYLIWKHKDNSVYTRNGYLISCDKIYYYGLSTIFETYIEKNITFSKNELQNYLSDFSLENYTKNSLPHASSLEPNSSHLYKKDSDKKSLFYYYISKARSSAIPELKILFYTIVLESLFSTDTHEINHKIAERISLIFFDNKYKRIDCYEKIKDAYDIRSKIAHGSFVKNSYDNSRNQKHIELVLFLDDLCRKIINNNKFDILFNSENNYIEQYFKDILFEM